MRETTAENPSWTSYQLGLIVGTLLELLSKFTNSGNNFLAGLEDSICSRQSRLEDRG
jgi:hypothetical protein